MSSTQNVSCWVWSSQRVAPFHPRAVLCPVNFGQKAAFSSRNCITCFSWLHHIEITKNLLSCLFEGLQCDLTKKSTWNILCCLFKGLQHNLTKNIQFEFFIKIHQFGTISYGDCSAVVGLNQKRFSQYTAPLYMLSSGIGFLAIGAMPSA